LKAVSKLLHTVRRERWEGEPARRTNNDDGAEERVEGRLLLLVLILTWPGDREERGKGEREERGWKNATKKRREEREGRRGVQGGLAEAEGRLESVGRVCRRREQVSKRKEGEELV
jgi:hypothetical protein